jgi:tetratricopeptide (TPR) repeat protein
MISLVVNGARIVSRTIVVLLLLLSTINLQSAGNSDLLKTAGVYYKKGDYLNAFQIYQQALKDDLDSWEANMGVGNALFKMGRRKTALSYYQRSLELNPDNQKLKEFLKKAEDQLAGRQPAGSPLGGKGIDWLDSYNSGMERGNRQKKFMLLFFYTEFNAALPLLERKVFSNEGVIRLAREFICIRVDGNANRYLSRSYQVGGYPTIIFIDGDENEKARRMGLREPGELVQLMQKVLAKKGKWRDAGPR